MKFNGFHNIEVATNDLISLYSFLHDYIFFEFIHAKSPRPDLKTNVNYQSNMIDRYLTVDGVSGGEYKEKGSKFISRVMPLNFEGELQSKLETIKKDHPKARHICYAYRIGTQKLIFRTNDDGEPSGTAGKPILAAIDSKGVSDVLVAVVRYFGGIKLGVSGLANAYRLAAHEGLKYALLTEKTLYNQIKVEYDYSHMGVVLDAIKKMEVGIHEMNWNPIPFVILQVRLSEAVDFDKQLKAILLGRAPGDIDDDLEVPYCRIIPF